VDNMSFQRLSKCLWRQKLVICYETKWSTYRNV